MGAAKGKIKYTEQEILNNSFDENVGLLLMLLWGYDYDNDGARKIAVDSEGNIKISQQNPNQGLNPSVSITETVLGTVTTKTIVKTIGAETYTKTVAMDSSDNSVNISAWS